jgi:hypothetical protein
MVFAYLLPEVRNHPQLFFSNIKGISSDTSFERPICKEYNALFFNIFKAYVLKMKTNSISSTLFNATNVQNGHRFSLGKLQLDTTLRFVTSPV